MGNKLFSFIKAIKYCLKLSWSTSRLYFSMRSFVLVAYAIIPFISLNATKLFIDSLQNVSESNTMSTLILLLIIIVFTSVMLHIINLANAYLQSVHDDLVDYKISEMLMKKTLDVDIEFFDSPDYLNTLQSIMIDSRSLVSIIWGILNGISSLISLSISILMIGPYNWMYALVIVLASIPSAILSKQFSQTLYNWRLSNLHEERQKSYLQLLTRDKAYASEIRIFNLNDFILSRYKVFWEYCFKGKKRIQGKKLIYTIPALILPELAVLFFLFSITQGIIEGTYSIGDFTLFLGLFTSLINATITVIRDFSSVYEDKLKIETLNKFFNYKNCIENTGKLDLQVINSIEFKNVSFRYPKTEKYILKNISFKIKKNQRVCIIGANGSGKSTLLKLMLRFYDVSDGEILINCKNIQEYNLLSLRQAFSISFQDYVSYAFTLRDNIRMSSIQNKEWTDADAYRALDLVGATSLLEKMPDGLNTYLHKIFNVDGYEASGGEYQKIALARAINRSCSILVLDEPTASLDPVSEYNLYNNLKDKIIEKTLIFTSHRLSAVHLSDTIILIEDGEIKEQGRHEELMDLNNKYADLYRLQANTYN